MAREVDKKTKKRLHPELSKYLQLKVRNFTVGKSWNGLNDTPHDGETYLDDLDKSLLYEQILWVENNKMEAFKIYPSQEKKFNHDIDLVLNETNHYLFYQNYSRPKIAYNVWESTLQPEGFFNKLKEFDELWVPSKWQKEETIKQGYPEDKIKVVPEGVDVNTFFPEETKHELTSDGRFKFFLAGRWDYRKSTKEIIETFIKTFNKDEPVDLIVSIDNPFSGDKLDTTENRLKYYNLEGLAYSNLMALLLYNTVRFIFIYKKFNLQPYTIKHAIFLLASIGLILLIHLFPTMNYILANILIQSLAFGICFYLLVLWINPAPEIHNMVQDFIKVKIPSFFKKK